MIWNPGDDTDLNEGGAGVDTVEVNGGNGAEQFTTTANGTRVRFDRLSPAPFSIDIGTSEKLIAQRQRRRRHVLRDRQPGRADRRSRSTAAPATTRCSAPTASTSCSAATAPTSSTASRATTPRFLGAGDDTFQWDPGDGSDTVEGQDGRDTMLFNGSAANEIMDASANGGRVRFTRNIANIMMDLNDVETIDANALGGADTLDGQRPHRHRPHAASTPTSPPSAARGDVAADNVIVNGTNGDDVVTVAGGADRVTVSGLAAAVDVTGAERRRTTA